MDRKITASFSATLRLRPPPPTMNRNGSDALSVEGFALSTMTQMKVTLLSLTPPPPPLQHFYSRELGRLMQVQRDEEIAMMREAESRKKLDAAVAQLESDNAAMWRLLKLEGVRAAVFSLRQPELTSLLDKLTEARRV